MKIVTRANLLICAMILGGVVLGLVAIVGARLFYAVTKPMNGPVFSLRDDVKPLDQNDESIMQAFMLVTPAINVQRAGFAAEIDTMGCIYHVRLTMTKEGVDQLLESGWRVNNASLDPSYDSLSVQNGIGSSNWDYFPRLPSDITIINQVAADSGDTAQGIIRHGAIGYVVFIDRKVSYNAVPQNVRSIMAAGGCSSAFASQSELDFRLWTGDRK